VIYLAWLRLRQPTAETKPCEIDHFATTITI